ncbi:MAG: alkaline phosphatase PhoX, partial [Ignavibacteria bacterium]
MFNLEKLIHAKISRRDLLSKAGKTTAFLAVGSILPNQFFDRLIHPEDKSLSKSNISFLPIDASMEDRLILPDGFNFNIIRMWGDKINAEEYFGYNNDFVAYLPIDLLNGGNNSEDGLISVNHEYPSPLFINNYSDEDFENGRIKTKEEVDAEMRSVGLSIFRVKKVNGEWKFTDDENYNRRIDANTFIKMSGKAKDRFPEFVKGTLANCSGGVTPWGTILSAEENFQDYFAADNYWEYRWNDTEKDFNTENYGWVVEVDPFNKNSVPVKRTSLGRFRHENVAIVISGNEKAVAYMGDDKVNECVYKFVSNKNFDRVNRENNSDILDEGKLYHYEGNYSYFL